MHRPIELDTSHEQRLGDADMQKIARLVYETAGIVLDDSKRALVVGRLAKRLRALGLRSYREYVRLLCDNPASDELENLINAITTNKTSFFREPHHFAYLRQQIEERMRLASRRSDLKRLNVWSAGCSTGEEPYSIAMTIAETLGPDLASWEVKILGTDIDSNVLATASRGAYPRDRTVGLPVNMRKFLEPAVLADGTPVSVVRRDLRKLVTFDQLNFVEPEWKVGRGFDHIFCRNVTIYFDRPTQAKLYPRLVERLAQDGSFYAGHSENLTWLPELLRPAGLTVYVHASAPPSARGRAAGPPSSRRHPAPSVRRPSRRNWSGDFAEASVNAGDVIASSEPMVLRTTLGSCVSVCLYDPLAKVGGMNHFMLPAAKDAVDASDRFGIQAMETLINKLLKLGASRQRLVAKIAGASNVLQIDVDRRSVAERNLEFVEQFLRTEGFTIAGRRVGGAQALEVRFRTDTGEAVVRAVDPAWTQDVARSEATYASRVARPAVADDDGITWFR